MHLFGVVQAHRTSLNLPEPHHYIDSKVCRVLSHEFGVVRPYRTVSVWCARCLYILVRGGSSTSNLLEPHHYKVFRVLSHEFGVVRLYRTFSIYIVAGETRCAGCLMHLFGVEFCHMSSGWFDCTEPSLSTSLQGVQGAYALVRGGSSTSNLIEPSRTTSLQR